MLGQPREARDKKELLSRILRGSLTPRQEECGQVQIREVGWVRRKNSGAARRIPGSGKFGHGGEGSRRPEGFFFHSRSLSAVWKGREGFGEALPLWVTERLHKFGWGSVIRRGAAGECTEDVETLAPTH